MSNINLNVKNNLFSKKDEEIPLSTNEPLKTFPLSPEIKSTKYGVTKSRHKIADHTHI